jgi:hypothetical protein
MPEDEMNDIVDQARRLAHGHAITRPHPYIRLWVLMKNLKNVCGGALPNGGGWLDQDYETMYALEIIERTYDEELEIREKMRNAASTFGSTVDAAQSVPVIDLLSHDGS